MRYVGMAVGYGYIAQTMGGYAWCYDCRSESVLERTVMMARSTSSTASGAQNKSTMNDPFNMNEALRAFTTSMDRDAFMQQHRKNIEALTAANTMAAEV